MLLVATPFVYQWVAGWLTDRELEQIYREMDAEDPHWRWHDLIAQLPAPPPDDRNAAGQPEERPEEDRLSRRNTTRTAKAQVTDLGLH